MDVSFSNEIADFFVSLAENYFIQVRTEKVPL
jgi:hypothetical protein